MSKVRRIHVTCITSMRIGYYCFIILYQQIRVTCIRLSLDIYMIRSFCHKIECICLLYCRLYSDSLRLLSIKSRSDCSNFAFCFLISSIIFRLLLLSYIVNIVVVCHNRITRRKCDTQILSLFYRASFQHIELKPTDVTISILFIYCRISTCFGPTGPSSGEFTQLFTQPLAQCLYCCGRVLCTTYRVHGQSNTHTEPMVV